MRLARDDGLVLAGDDRDLLGRRDGHCSATAVATAATGRLLDGRRAARRRGLGLAQPLVRGLQLGLELAPVRPRAARAKNAAAIPTTTRRAATTADTQNSETALPGADDVVDVDQVPLLSAPDGDDDQSDDDEQMRAFRTGPPVALSTRV